MPTQSRGRPVKFTPERIQQIKNLVERSKSREEIAELIGVTVDSLQVTCSRLGISLRRPTFNNGLVSLRRNEPRLDQVHTPRSGHGSDMHLIKGDRSEMRRLSRTKLNALGPFGKPANEAGAASFAIKMQYRGEERVTELPLTQDMITQLAVEAAFRSVPICDLIGHLIMESCNRHARKEARPTPSWVAEAEPEAG